MAAIPTIRFYPAIDIRLLHEVRATKRFIEKNGDDKWEKICNVLNETIDTGKVTRRQCKEGFDTPLKKNEAKEIKSLKA